jgi:hypothetical protein
MKVEDVAKELLETTARILCCGDDGSRPDRCSSSCSGIAANTKRASRILAAVIPAIQREALERAAVLVETSLYIMSGSQPSHLQHDPKRAKNDNHHATIAAAIRAMKEGT